jgi:hypothetical protein
VAGSVAVASCENRPMPVRGTGSARPAAGTSKT